MRRARNNIHIDKIHIAPSGCLYMFGRMNHVWFVRCADGVELAKRPLILIDRLDNKLSTPNYKDPLIKWEDAYERLMQVGICQDDMGCWEIAGLDIPTDELYRKSKLVYESKSLEGVQGMFDFIANMAKMSDRFGKGELRMDFLGDYERDPDKKPHLHYRLGDSYVASIDLLSGELLRGELPINYKRDIMKCIKANLLYYKFCWDFLNKQEVFKGEYDGREDDFRARLYQDNPNLR